MTDRDEKLRQLGELLKQERLHQGRSHDEIMEITKISRRSLVAIEEGERGDLPHPVYAKGFIKNYAGALGLPWERYAELLANSFDLEEEDEEEDNGFVGDSSRADAASRPKGRGPAAALVLALVLIVFLGGLVWYMYRGDNAKPAPEAAVQSQAEPEAEKTEPPKPEPQAVAPAETPAEAPAVPAPESTEGADEQAAPAEAEAPQAPAVPAEPVAAPAEEAPAAAQAEEPVPAHTIVVKALDDGSCWMQVRADQGEIKEYFIRDGQSVRFAYESALWIRLGNAGGVTVSQDGQDYPLNASPGQVRTLRFGDAQEE